MRKQVTVTKATQASWSELVGEDIAAGAVLTVTSPKQVVGRECECGCGGKTSGGLWVPGHDAKHKSRLFALVRGTDPMQAELARAELGRRGWPLPQGRAGVAPAPLPVPAATE